jgi:hypothetical protein
MTDKSVILATGWEGAFIGVAHHFGGATGTVSIAVYDYGKMVSICVKRDGMSEDEAQEFLEFNTLGASFGPGTPAYLVFRGTIDEAKTYMEERS